MYESMIRILSELYKLQYKKKANKQTNKKSLYSSPKIMASAYPVFKFGRVRLGVRVPSFHNFGNLGGQLKSRYDDARSEK